MPNFKLKYENSENIRADCVNTVVFNLHEIKRRAFFWDTRYLDKDFSYFQTMYNFNFPCLNQTRI